MAFSAKNFLQNAPAGAWEGINPDESLHRTVLRVEKKTGLAVDASKKIQGGIFGNIITVNICYKATWL